MENAVYTAGFARLDITPPLGVAIPGAWNKRVGVGVLDPLFVNAIAFGRGDDCAVLLCLDLLGLYGTFAGQLPEKVASAVGLPKEAVFICCTHTHTSPSLGTDALYDEWFVRRLCDAATIAMRERKPVTDVQWAEANAEGLAFVRRYYIKDGTVLTNPLASEVVRYACENDDSMRLVRILREDAPEIAIVNFQSHPDNTGGEYYSADYPGALRDRVEQGRSGVHCVFLDGAQGQMVRSSRFLPRVPASHQAAFDYGYKLGDFALGLFDKTVSTGKQGLSFGQQVTQLKTKRDSSRVPEAERIVALRMEGRNEEIHPSVKFANYLYSEANRILSLEKANLDYLPATVSAISFCGLALVGIPGEPFNELGKAIRTASGYSVTCVCCQTNGSLGYFPDSKGFDQGGYESYNTSVIKGSGEQLAETGIELLASFPK